MIKIGYQGEIGSNSEEAAKTFVSKLNLTNVTLVPLISSKNVIEQLKSGIINYGVVATENSIAGKVKETAEALNGENFNIVSIEKLPIHHCLFRKPGVKNEDITTIASHIQALNQTVNNRNKYFPNCKVVEMKDTALAAQMLAKNILSDDYAVLCRKNAGENNGLKLMMENLEDFNNNETEFYLLKL